jgi:hypothetical protein
MKIIRSYTLEEIDATQMFKAGTKLILAEINDKFNYLSEKYEKWVVFYLEPDGMTEFFKKEFRQFSKAYQNYDERFDTRMSIRDINKFNHQWNEKYLEAKRKFFMGAE